MQQPERILKNLADIEPQKQDALARVVDEIGADARQDPSRYLEDTLVPEGGE